MAITITQANAVNAVLKSFVGYPGFSREEGIDALVLLLEGAYKVLHAGFTPEEGRIVLERRLPDAAKIERHRVELRDKGNDLLDIRGILSPNGRPRAVPMELGDRVAPAIEWLVSRVAELEQQLADVAPYAEAGKQAAAEAAEREYRNGSCDDCMCCTTAQCAEHRCPTDSIGDSICPCTCY